MNNEEKIYDLLEKIYIELQDTKKELKNLKDETSSRFNKVDTKFDETNTKIDNNHKEINAKVDINHAKILNELQEIKEQIHELDTKNAANHIATNTRLDKISDDLDFLTHKEFQAEKEIFKLKKKIVK